MCRQCLRIVEFLHPNATEQEMNDLLWSCSPFPAGAPRDIYYSMRQCLRASKGSVSGAVKFANDQLEKSMKKLALADSATCLS